MPSQAGCGVKRFIRPDYTQGETGGFTVPQTAIASGPNKGAYYVTSATFYSYTGSAVNPHLKSSSSTTYSSTDPGQSQCSPMNWYDANDCLGGASSQAFVAGILNHEGRGTTGTNGHQSFWELEAGKAAYDPMAAVEGIVGMDRGDLMLDVEAAVNNRSTSLQTVVDAKGEPSGNFPSAVRWLWEATSLFWMPDRLNGG